MECEVNGVGVEVEAALLIKVVSGKVVAPDVVCSFSVASSTVDVSF